MVRFGIMGCGGISDRFCSVLNKENGVSIQAVAARDLGKAEAFAKKHGANTSCTYEELVRDSKVDIVYIGTVHSHHYEQIKLCLENGKPVLCEKPMVLHGDDARECFALAKEKGLLLMEAMWTRMNPCIIEATCWVREGAIGDVKLVTADFCYNAPYDPESRIFNPELAGGALYDVGVYVVEFAGGILGEGPNHIAAAVQFAQTGADTYTALSLSYPGGAVASLTCGVTAATPHSGAVYGTKGSIVFSGEFWRTHDAICYDNGGNIVESFHEDFEDGFCYMIRHVVDLINSGAIESRLIPWKDTVACADLFDRVLGGKNK